MREDEVAETIALEARGDGCLDLLRAVLQLLALTDVRRVRIELDAEPGLVDREAVGAFLDGDSESDVAEDVEQAEPEEPIDFDGEDVSHVPSLHAGAQPALVLRRLCDANGDTFRSLGQIGDLFTDEELNSMSNLSGLLWRLADRGLVEKKASPQSGQAKQYRITSKGAAAVEDLNRRTEGDGA